MVISIEQERLFTTADYDPSHSVDVDQVEVPFLRISIRYLVTHAPLLSEAVQLILMLVEKFVDVTDAGIVGTLDILALP